MIIFRPYGDKDSPLASNFYHGLWSLFGGGPTTDSHLESDYGDNPLPDSYEAILHYLHEREPWADKMTNLHPARMKWADHRLEHLGLTRAATKLDQYVNVRPVHAIPGIESPLRRCSSTTLTGSFSAKIARENTPAKGPPPMGEPRTRLPLTLQSILMESLSGPMRFTFETARSQTRKHLAMVTKSNAQRHGMVFWDQVFDVLIPEYPDVSCDRILVGAMTVRVEQKPNSLNTILATNLHGDILSDLAAALAGSIGIAPSNNLDPTRQNPKHV